MGNRLPPFIRVRLAIGLLAMACAPAWAQQQWESNNPAPRQRDEQTLSESVRRVEQQTGGQVLAAERMQFDGRDINRIKVLDDSGRVRVFMDDPKASGNKAGSTRRDDE